MTNFKNISNTETGFNVRYQDGNKDKSRHFTDIKQALKFRNEKYKFNYHPYHLLIDIFQKRKSFPINDYFHKKFQRFERRIQIHTREIKTYKYKPSTVHVTSNLSDKSAMIKAGNIYKKYTSEINPIIKLYNEKRIKWLNELAALELETLESHIPSSIIFDPSLWDDCYKELNQ